MRYLYSAFLVARLERVIVVAGVGARVGTMQPEILKGKRTHRDASAIKSWKPRYCATLVLSSTTQSSLPVKYDWSARADTSGVPVLTMCLEAHNLEAH